METNSGRSREVGLIAVWVGHSCPTPLTLILVVQKTIDATLNGTELRLTQPASSVKEHERDARAYIARTIRACLAREILPPARKEACQRISHAFQQYPVFRSERTFAIALHA